MIKKRWWHDNRTTIWYQMSVQSFETRCTVLGKHHRLFLFWERSGSAWLATEGPRVRASPASLCCGPWARHIYPSLVLIQPMETRPCLTERVLMGRKESNQTKNIGFCTCTRTSTVSTWVSTVFTIFFNFTYCNVYCKGGRGYGALKMAYH